MWPFKKVSQEAKFTVNTILCVPGYWEDKIEIFAKTNGDYMVVADILMDVKNKKQYKFEITVHDPKMYNAFKYSGKSSGVTEEFLERISSHKSVVYVSCEINAIDDIKHLAEIGVMLLETGGIGIKVETAGKAFEGDKWAELTNRGDLGALYKMFVADNIVTKDGTVFSCGMHNLGYPDVIISSLNFGDAIKVLSSFNFYQLVDKPTIKDGQTFQTVIDSPFYRIRCEKNQPYVGDELFENPFGMWRLTKE